MAIVHDRHVGEAGGHTAHTCLCWDRSAVAVLSLSEESQSKRGSGTPWPYEQAQAHKLPQQTTTHLQ